MKAVMASVVVTAIAAEKMSGPPKVVSEQGIVFGNSFTRLSSIRLLVWFWLLFFNVLRYNGARQRSTITNVVSSAEQ